MSDRYFDDHVEKLRRATFNPIEIWNANGKERFGKDWIYKRDRFGKEIPGYKEMIEAELDFLKAERDSWQRRVDKWESYLVDLAMERNK